MLSPRREGAVRRGVTGSGSRSRCESRNARGRSRDTTPSAVEDMQKLIPNIPVADVERSVEFYRHVLGFDLIGVRGRGDATRAHLRLGDVEMIFRSLDVYAPLPYLDPALENQLILHIQVEDVVGLFHRIREQVNVLRSLEPTLFGSAEFSIRDIDGRILVFSQAGAAAHGRLESRSQAEDAER